MTQLSDEEQWARERIREALDGIEVRQHDDGSRAGLHDIDIAMQMVPRKRLAMYVSSDD
jgi:hypothetical protein